MTGGTSNVSCRESNGVEKITADCIKPHKTVEKTVETNLLTWRDLVDCNHATNTRVDSEKSNQSHETRSLRRSRETQAYLRAEGDMWQPRGQTSDGRQSRE